MEENELQIIEYGEQRVVTTRQIAGAYETSAKNVTYNFRNNKDRFQEGKHYFVLYGEEKQDFINRNEIPSGSKKAKTLYLWTEKGALLLAKSINTDTAWDAYDRLVDFYFEKKENTAVTVTGNTDMQILMQNISAILTQTTTKMVEAITALSDRVEKLEQRRLPQGKPDGDTWYDNNCNKIFNAAEKKNSTAKHIIHLILLELRKSYDIDYAMELYEQTTGSKPTYALEIIESYPNMQRTATNFLNSILIEKPKVYEKEEIFQFK